jgi:DNA-directed RNA polymerase specialized sigma24 family protein
MNSIQRSPIPFISFSPTLTEPQRALVEALYRRHERALVAYAVTRLGDAISAEDIVHDAFVDVVSGVVPFPAVDTLSALRAVVRRRCARLQRHSARREAKQLREEVKAWRSWRNALRSRHDPRSDEEEEER